MFQKGKNTQNKTAPASNSSGQPVTTATTIVKPIVYGNVTRRILETAEQHPKLPENQADSEHQKECFEWTVYLKSPVNEDMSAYLRKVQFELHSSFAVPRRVLTEPPYQITEKGWGEFDITIRLYWADTSQRPLALVHQLKLFNRTPDDNLAALTEYPLVSERYDELLFATPSALMQERLNLAPQLPAHLQEKIITDWESKKAETLAAISEAKQSVARQIEEYRGKLEAYRQAMLEKTIKEKAEAETEVGDVLASRTKTLTLKDKETNE